MARSRRAARYSSVSSTRYPTTVYVTVPVPSYLRTRTVSYTYPYQYSRARRVVRVPLVVRPTRYELRRIAVRVPRHLPLVKPSYVSLVRGRLNIHSRRQTRVLIQKGEFNRARNEERKGRRRQARNGQLDSVRSDRHGIIAAANAMGLSPQRIADAAMVSRAVGG